MAASKISVDLPPHSHSHCMCVCVCVCSSMNKMIRNQMWDEKRGQKPLNGINMADKTKQNKKNGKDEISPNSSISIQSHSHLLFHAWSFIFHCDHFIEIDPTKKPPLIVIISNVLSILNANAEKKNKHQVNNEPECGNIRILRID